MCDYDEWDDFGTNSSSQVAPVQQTSINPSNVNVSARIQDGRNPIGRGRGQIFKNSFSDRKPNFNNNSNQDDWNDNETGKSFSSYNNSSDKNFNRNDDGNRRDRRYNSRSDENSEYKDNYDGNRRERRPNFRSDENNEMNNDDRNNRRFRKPNFRSEGNNDFDDNNDDGGNKGRGRSNFRSEENDESNAEKKPERMTYVPPEISGLEIDDEADGDCQNFFNQYDKTEVRCTGDNVPQPISSFESSSLCEILLQNIRNMRYTKPTPIQKYSIPCISEGRDVMACASTGSGKSAAFLLPMLDSLIRSDSTVGTTRKVEPLILIIEPTRELAIQIADTSISLCKGTYIKTAVVYGGTNVFEQRKRMSAAHIIIATVGRLKDFMNKGFIGLSSVKFVVLDEADRMLDMGFQDEIDQIMRDQTMPEQKQTLMFSATFSEDIQRLASNYLNDYIFIAVGVIGSACKDVEQIFYEVKPSEKYDKLREILQQEDNKDILIFVERKKTADFLGASLSEDNFSATTIHSDRYQEQREQALNDFRRRKVGILVATSVAARGLDIRRIKHVINYDLPNDVTEYVHRIGRTGRMGSYGKATSFYDASKNSNLADDIVKVLRQAGQKVPDFLQSSSSGRYANEKSYHDKSTFGGYDYRKSNNNDYRSTSNFAAPSSAAPSSAAPAAAAAAADEDDW